MDNQTLNPRSHDQHGQPKPVTSPKRLQGKLGNILLSCATLTLPFVIISAVVLALIFYHRVQHNPLSSANLSLSSTLDENTYIYTNISPTRIARIASLYTTVLTYIAASAVVLASYPLARFVLQRSQNGDADSLLTPYQLVLMVRFIEGSTFSAIKSWFGYLRRPARHQPGPALGIAFTATVTMMLGALIFASEWWLHFSIEPFNFSQVTPMSTAEGIYSYTLPANCLNTNNSYVAQESTPCSLSPSIRGGYLINPLTAYEVLNNLSTTASVNVYSNANQYAFLGTPGNGAPFSQDFTANTYSTQTQCQLVTKECGVSRDNLVSGVSAPFTCSKYPAFTGDLLSAQLAITYFTDSSGSSNRTFGTTGYVFSNPFYFAVTGNTLAAAGNDLPLHNDPEFVAMEFGGVAYLMFCNATVYDTQYTAVNGSITDFKTTPSNTSMSTMMLQTLYNTAAGGVKLQDSANLAGLSKTPEQFADTFALTYSQVLLSLVAGVMVPSPVNDLQAHSEIIVSRIPKVPLYILIILSFLFVAFGISLTIIALITSGDENVEEVRQRLSTQQIVAEKFESGRAHEPVSDLNECFGEFKQQSSASIGVVRSATGGWEVRNMKEPLMASGAWGSGYQYAQ